MASVYISIAALNLPFWKHWLPLSLSCSARSVAAAAFAAMLVMLVMVCAVDHTILNELFRVTRMAFSSDKTEVRMIT